MQDENHVTLLVSEEAENTRLDKFLADMLQSQFSRERIQTLIETGAVTIGGKPQLKASYRLKLDDLIELLIPEAQPLQLEAEPIPLTVVYEDDALLVVDKPAGMLTHPTGKEQTGTLVNALLHHCAGSLSSINGILRPGIVHRLDRDTTGLLMVAKTDQAHRFLSEQLKYKTARREYRAIIQGTLPTSMGTISAPIDRNPKHREKMAIIQTGRSAVTHWTVLEEIYGKFSYITLQLETGRTHQIRVHLSSKGYPIIGDPLYGSGIEKQIKLNVKRQLLQAFRLTFEHPVRHELVTFEIPEDPELTAAWAFLKKWGE